MAYNLKIYNTEGSSVGDYPLEDSSLEFEKGSQAVKDAVVAYMAGMRAGTASTKNRSEVKGGGQKPYRQKGLGRARSGSTRNPIWRGGGIIFGPKPRSFYKKVNKKVRALALKRAFSDKVKDGDVIVLEELKLPDHKTKNAVKIIENLKLEKSVLLIVKDLDENSLRATANISELLLTKTDAVNVYEVLRFDKLVFTKEALDDFVRRLNNQQEEAHEKSS